MRPRRAVGEALPAPLPGDPLRGALTRATDHHSRRGDRQPGSNKGNQPLPLAAAESGISMKNHRALLVVATPTSRTLGGLFDVTTSADRQQRRWDLHLGQYSPFPPTETFHRKVSLRSRPFNGESRDSHRT